MKNRVQIIIKIIVFIVIFGVLSSLLTKLLIRKEEYGKYQEFYSEKDRFDVLFFGSSRMLDAVWPMELWKDYGIKSYNMAQHSETLARSYWSVLNAIKYNKPGVIVVDVSLFAGQTYIDKDSSMEDKAYLHNTLDHMPMSIIKIKAINNLCSFSERGEYLFPLALYHSRWSSLTKDDIIPVRSPMKGAEVRDKTEPQQYSPWPTEEKSEVFLSEGLNLDRLIDLCEKNNIEPVFVCLPVPGADYYTTINSFEEYFHERGIPFINYWKDDSLLDYEKDFADDSHLNRSGAIKLSGAIGKYLSDHYSFDHENNKTDDEWNRELKEYMEQVH